MTFLSECSFRVYSSDMTVCPSCLPCKGGLQYVPVSSKESSVEKWSPGFMEMFDSSLVPS